MLDSLKASLLSLYLFGEVLRLPLPHNFLIMKDLIRTRRQIQDLLKEENQASQTFTDDTHRHLTMIIADGTIGGTKLLWHLYRQLGRESRALVVLTASMPLYIAWYFRSLGALEIVRLKPNSKSNSGHKLVQSLRERLAQFSSLTELRKMNYRSYRFYDAVLSTAQRATRSHTFRVHESVTLRQKIEQLTVKLPSWIDQCESLLDEMKPSLILGIEFGGWYRPLAEAAIERDVQVISCTQPHQENTVILKRLSTAGVRQHPNSVEKLALQELANLSPGQKRSAFVQVETHIKDRYSGTWKLMKRNQPGNLLANREELIKRYELDATKKISVLYSHVLWDANLFYGSDLFDDYTDWLLQSVRAMLNNPKVNWLIKIHPANLWKAELENSGLQWAEVVALQTSGLWPLPPHVKLIYPDDPLCNLSLFSNTDYGITVRGTVGIELAALGVPVLTAGSGRYAQLGFTRDYLDKDSYLEALRHIQDAPPMTQSEQELAKLHAFAVFILRPYPLVGLTPNLSEFRNHNPLALNFNFVEPLASDSLNDEADEFANWVLRSSEADYLRPAVQVLATR